MERAIAVNELDWRAITVEISQENLATALAGMHALKFMAVRFFPSLQQLVLREVAVSASLTFVGAATSAGWREDGWQVWHNWGLAVQDWAARKVAYSTLLCWLHGDSLRSRSTLYALHELASQKQLLPAAVVWTDPPKLIPTDLLELGAGTSTQRVHCVPTQYSESNENPRHTLDELLISLGGALESILLVGDQMPSELASERIQALPVLLAVQGDAAEGFAASFSSEITLLSEVDQTVASEVYDMKRWTGCPVEHSVLRDAYDEYYDI